MEKIQVGMQHVIFATYVHIGLTDQLALTVV